MAKQCPKCGSLRDEHDAAPAGSCPACGVVYEKYEALRQAQALRQAAAGDSARTAVPAAKPPRPTEAFNWNRLPAVFALAAVIIVIARFDVVRATVRNVFDKATSINSSATSGVALTVTALSCGGANEDVVVTGQVQNRSQNTLRLDAEVSIENREGGAGATLHGRAALDTTPLAPLAVSTFTVRFPLRPQVADHCRVSGFIDAEGRAVSFNLAPDLTPGLASDADERAR